MDFYDKYCEIVAAWIVNKFALSQLSCLMSKLESKGFAETARVANALLNFVRASVMHQTSIVRLSWEI